MNVYTTIYGAAATLLSCLIGSAISNSACVCILKMNSNHFSRRLCGHHFFFDFYRSVRDLRTLAERRRQHGILTDASNERICTFLATLCELADATFRCINFLVLRNITTNHVHLFLRKRVSSSSDRTGLVGNHVQMRKMGNYGEFTHESTNQLN